jgi:hypothetical protein
MDSGGLWRELGIKAQFYIAILTKSIWMGTLFPIVTIPKIAARMTGEVLKMSNHSTLARRMRPHPSATFLATLEAIFIQLQRLFERNAHPNFPIPKFTCL